MEERAADGDAEIKIVQDFSGISEKHAIEFIGKKVRIFFVNKILVY